MAIFVKLDKLVVALPHRAGWTAQLIAVMRIMPVKLALGQSRAALNYAAEADAIRLVSGIAGYARQIQNCRIKVDTSNWYANHTPPNPWNAHDQRLANTPFVKM